MLYKKIKSIVVVVLLIAIYPTSKWIWSEAAEAYFNHRCETDAGEFVYRTVENVEGVFQMRPRDPRDYFSRLRDEDLPEDPFGHTNTEAQGPWTLFLSNIKSKYKYFETTVTPSSFPYADSSKRKTFVETPVNTNEKYWIYFPEKIDYEKNNSTYRQLYSAKQASELKSKYGFTWQEVRSQWDKFFGVWGGELIVKKLATDETLGIRRGYFFWPVFSKKGAICPKDKSNLITYYFVSKVLIPIVN